MIYLIVTRRCAEIFLSNDDCGVGIGWFRPCGGTGRDRVYSGWKWYRMVRELFCSTKAQVPDQ